MKIDGTNLSMIRGDSESLKISLIHENGEDASFEKGDIVYFTVKENIRREEYLLQKVVTEFDEGEALITIDPADTDNLRPRSNYVYDIQLTRKNRSVITIVEPSRFSLIGDVTRE